MWNILAQVGAAGAAADGAAGGATGAGEPAVVEPISRLQKYLDSSIDYLVAGLPSAILALVILIAVYVIALWVRRWLLRGLMVAKFDITLSKFLANISRWAIMAIGVVVCLGTLGVNTTGLAAVLGAAGLAIGLALQGNLSNLASGVLLLIFRPFKIGDAVTVAGQAGVVDGIDLFTTNLDTPDNRRIIVPNAAIFGGVITNDSRHPTRRIDVNVPVGWLPPDEAEQLLKQAVANVLKIEGALSEPAPAVTLIEIHPNHIFAINVWVKASAFGVVRPALLKELRKVTMQGVQ